MTIIEALRIAKSRVSIVPQGNQYVLHTWSPRHNATWVSHPMDRRGAQCSAYEAKIRTALELLEIEDAGAVANIAVERTMGGFTPDWRKVVRQEYNSHSN